MKQTPKTIEREIKKLRKIVEASKDPVEKRVAYTIEHILRWAIEETVGWPKPHKTVADAVRCLKERL